MLTTSKLATERYPARIDDMTVLLQVRMEHAQYERTDIQNGDLSIEGLKQSMLDRYAASIFYTEDQQAQTGVYRE